MRFVSFRRPGGSPRVGVQRLDGGVVDLEQSDHSLPASLRDLIVAGPEALDRVRRTTERSDAVVVKNAVLAAPIPDPPKVLCIGLNYRDHAIETKAQIPKEPVVFNKFPSAVVGPEEAIRLPRESPQVDFEGELVVVVGKRGRRIPRERAMDYVFGYTVGHDVSARDWQKHKEGKQWLLGKSFDTFAPLGPAVVTTDEVPDPHALRIRTRLNGETMQDSNTGDMIFRIDELLAYISQVTTLEPGDLLYTGTPAGVGVARNPPRFLKPGDVVDVEIESLGVLRNPCVAD
jgi:2-keto-4-pentenoate hydratase/2-oxohepta-3-ene-1,7-dioic acid hydratase in catechol pathway